MAIKHRSHRGAIGPSPMAEVMGLQQIRPHKKGPTVRQLDMGDLQLGALAAQHSKILAPIELKRLARSKDQRHEGSAPWGLACLLPLRPPVTRKRCNTAIGTGEAQYHQIRMQLLCRSPLLA